MPKHLLLPLLCIGLAAPAAAQVELRAPEEIAGFLAPLLKDVAAPAGASLEQTRARLEKRLPEWLATEGYFSPRIAIERKGDGLEVSIDPGPRTRVSTVDIAIDGDLPPGRRQSLLAGWLLTPGEPFRQEDWSDAKQDLLLRLLAADFAGARLTDSRAEIDPETRQARLEARYAAGPRYRFGPLRIEGLSRYEPELVERFNRSVHPGEPYREKDLAALQNALQATPYFNSVQVELEREEAGEPGPDGTVTAPVRLLVQERPAHRVAFGAGASSNTGARVELNYRSADLFRNAWELSSGLRLEQKRQILYGDIFLPPDREGRRHSFGSLVEHTNIQNLATERFAIGAQRRQQRGSVEMRLALDWQHERQRPADAPEKISQALVANGTWIWRRVDSLLDPRRGTVLQAQLGGASRAALSDQDFLRFYGRVQQFVPLGRQNVLTLRGELGRTAAESRQGIPQDYLFRAGGTNSVRGYSYQSLGVREGDAVVGGRYLATASAELTHWLDERWGIAAFVDAGNAGDVRSRLDPVLGYGLGARWKSPAGPLAVDVAYGRDAGKLQLHFSLAIPF